MLIFGIVNDILLGQNLLFPLKAKSLLTSEDKLHVSYLLNVSAVSNTCTGSTLYPKYSSFCTFLFTLTLLAFPLASHPLLHPFYPFIQHHYYLKTITNSTVQKNDLKKLTKEIKVYYRLELT